MDGWRAGGSVHWKCWVLLASCCNLIKQALHFLLHGIKLLILTSSGSLNLNWEGGMVLQLPTEVAG